MQPVYGSIPEANPVVEQRYTRSQTYAADLTDDQKIAFDLCRAGATWFYNEASRSQLDRYRHRVPVEGFQGLSYQGHGEVMKRGCDLHHDFAVSLAQTRSGRTGHRSNTGSSWPARELPGSLRNAKSGTGSRTSSSESSRSMPRSHTGRCLDTGQA